MYFEERKNRKGEKFYVANERYVDPLTGKKKRASVVYHSNTPRARRQAERELLDKIDNLISMKEEEFKVSNMTTFVELKTRWLEEWQTTVKPQTIKRELLVIERLSELIADDILLEKITPMFIKNCLNEYKEKYQSTHSTMQHIKCTLNKIFDYAVLYNAISFSPLKVVKLDATIDAKKAKKQRLDKKFLNEEEVKVLLSELSKCRNQNYYDLTLFLIGTGCRIGEASALMEEDIDFENRTVTIDKSLQSHDLKVDEYRLDTTKTEAGERVEHLPDFALEALKRVIARNKKFDEHAEKFPSSTFRKTEFLFKTEYGSPITSHSFRTILRRVNDYLYLNCKKMYDFSWTKNAVPHSFRHIHISVLQSYNVPLKELQERVGHVKAETTYGYTHRMNSSQQKSVEAISDFADKVVVK